MHLAEFVLGAQYVPRHGKLLPLPEVALLTVYIFLVHLPNAAGLNFFLEATPREDHRKPAAARSSPIARSEPSAARDVLGASGWKWRSLLPRALCPTV